MNETVLRLDGRDGAVDRTVEIHDLVIAGWTGRDPEAMEAHIRELEALGVTRPPATPMYYRVAADRLTTAPVISVLGDDSSGEIEFVLIGTGEGMLIGIGSDHTDRTVEAYGVTVSKQMCDKPIAPVVWRHEEVADHWDKLVLRSWIVVDGESRLYQEGSVAHMLSPGELVRGYDGADSLAEGVALFGGTVPAKGGVRSAERFEGELEDPVLERRIRFAYDIRTLPIRG